MQPRKSAIIKLSDELEHSRKELLSGRSNPQLLAALKANIPALSDNVYVLDWIPEQAEDIFTLLIDGYHIVEVELSRLAPMEPPISFKVSELGTYLNCRPQLGKTMRRRLEVAIKLSCRT